MTATILVEYLEIDVIHLGNPAYHTLSLDPLYTRRKVGTNRRVGNGATVPYKKVTTEVTSELVVKVNGSLDEDGLAVADRRQGLDTHLRTLEAGLVDDVAGISGVLAAVWHRPVSNREADVQIDGWSVERQNDGEAVCRFALTVPAGRWVDVTP